MQLRQIVIPLAPAGLKHNDVLHVFIKAFYHAFSTKQNKFQNVTFCLKYLLDGKKRANGVSKKRKRKTNKEDSILKAKKNKEQQMHDV